MADIPNTISSLLKKSFYIASSQLYIIFFAGLISAISPILMTGLTSWFLNNAHHGIIATNLLVLMSIFGAIVGFLLLGFWNELYIKVINAKLLACIVPDLIMNILYMPSQNFKICASAEWSQKLSDYDNALNQFFPKFISLIINICGLLLLISFLAFSMPMIALGYVIIAILIGLIKYLITSKNTKFITKQIIQKAKISLLLQETFFQIIKIRSTNSLDIIKKQWLTRLINLKLVTWRSIQLEIINSSLDYIMPLLILAILCVFLIFSENSMHALDMLLMLMMSGSQFLMMFDKCLSDIAGLMTIKPAIEQIQQFNLSQRELTKPELDVPLHGGLKLMNVSFVNEFNQTILNNITFDIPPGIFMGIIGKSGSGKSSLLRLLLNLLQPSSGKILLDDIPLSHISSISFRKQSAAVLQTSTLFPGTIYYNIALHTDMTLDAVWELARNVGLDQEIKAMPMGMFTQISDNANESISGGQKQKILIARALANQPKILCLDEATSALDNHSQAVIFNHLKTLPMTKIVIAHRHSTLLDADYIYKLEAGEMTCINLII